MAEWSNALGLKTRGVQASEGSNPSASAKLYNNMRLMVLYMFIAMILAILIDVEDNNRLIKNPLYILLVILIFGGLLFI